MREILDFFKDIFMINKEPKYVIGLSQFNVRKKELAKTTQTPKTKKSILNFTDLMNSTPN
ncbi:hypothetical protein IJE86_00990 [bacterium]|nr:hypothetical protein [bacterium]